MLVCLFFTQPAYSAQSTDCLSDHIDQYAIVQQIYDGDTVKLTNGKKIRLIGINTPEMNYKTGVPEPFAVAAKSFLKQKVLKRKIGLRYGSDKKDRYGRYLAHIFLGDGLNLQQALLQKGYAYNISIPPNLWQQTCYLDSENEARLAQRGLWSNHQKSIINAEQIRRNQTGFQFVKGTIRQIREDKRAIWLKISNKMTLKINRKNLPYFKNFNFDRLRNRELIARGWVSQRKKQFYMSIKHPNSIQLL